MGGGACPVRGGHQAPRRRPRGRPRPPARVMDAGTCHRAGVQGRGGAPREREGPSIPVCMPNIQHSTFIPEYLVLTTHAYSTTCCSAVITLSTRLQAELSRLNYFYVSGIKTPGYGRRDAISALFPATTKIQAFQASKGMIPPAVLFLAWRGATCSSGRVGSAQQ